MARSGNPHPANAGKGRKRGVPNKVPSAVKDMILQALANVGGCAYLERQAEKNPTAFLSLVGRVLPVQLKEGGAEPMMPKQVIFVMEEASDAPPAGGPRHVLHEFHDA